MGLMTWPEKCMYRIVDLGLRACLKRQFFPVTAALKRIRCSIQLSAAALLSYKSGRSTGVKVPVLLKIYY